MAGDLRSSHLRKWAAELTKAGITIGVFSLCDSDRSKYPPGIRIYTAGVPSSVADREEGSLQKLLYLIHVKKLRQAIRDFKPDALHSHYLTSFGLLGAISGFRPFIVSVWGSDIFDFPKRSALHKSLIKYILKKADKVLSTSRFMAQEVKKYYDGNIEVTPFGVDLSRFRPAGKTAGETVRIGIIKNLEEVYGIELFLNALKILKEKGVKGFTAEITGDGSFRDRLHRITEENELTEIVEFNGFVDNSEIENIHRRYDFEVYPSYKDSFGVSAVEAMACGVPVIVSSDTGLADVAEDQVSGLIFPNGSLNGLAACIEKLINEADLRIRLAEGARKRAEEHFDIKYCTGKMITVYESINKN